jgi:hypothetical protein
MMYRMEKLLQRSFIFILIKSIAEYLNDMDEEEEWEDDEDDEAREDEEDMEKLYS